MNKIDLQKNRKACQRNINLSKKTGKKIRSTVEEDEVTIEVIGC